MFEPIVFIAGFICASTVVIILQFLDLKKHLNDNPPCIIAPHTDPVAQQLSEILTAEDLCSDDQKSLCMLVLKVKPDVMKDRLDLDKPSPASDDAET